MAKKSAFILPDGLDLQVSDGTLSLKYDGNVTLRQTLGCRIGTIDVTGDLELALPEINGTISAGGKITLKSPKVDATIITGAEVNAKAVKTLRARGMQATESIVIGPTRLTIDALLAPNVELDSKATGRVTVIEANNAWGPSNIKGGLSLGDYEEIIGDANEFLSSRGLSAAGAAAAQPPPEVPPPLPPVPAADEAETEADVDDLEMEIDDPEPVDEVEEIEEIDEVDAEIEAETAPPELEEDTSDPVTLSAQDLEPVEDELQPKLQDALKRIVACYEGDELPVSVAELKTLVDARDYDVLKGRITDVWNGLLGFHQKRGIRPHHQVTHAFNVIHGLVQSA
jgi:hypothetical protein